MDVLSTVKRTIEDHNLIKKGDTVLLGFSGGPDSLCLLSVLAELRDSMGFSLQALHVNHRLRGDAANEDMKWVVSYCKKLSIPVKIVICDVASKASKDGTSVEEAGRQVRHKALHDKANALGGALIALAHNQDDQAETVLMRVIRGTGVHGLAAMDYKRDDGIIRPLLDVPRKEIEAYCKARGLSPRMDESNKSLEYTRNKIRLKLIPGIEKDFNPNFKQGLVRLADNAREDDLYLTKLAKRELNRTNDSCEMNADLLVRIDPAIAKRVIRFMFARVGLTEDIGAVHINRLISAVSSGSGNAVLEFPKGYTAEVRYGKVAFKAPEVKQTKKEEYFLFHNVVLRDEVPPLPKLGKMRAALDAEKVASLGTDICLRTRQTGDYIVPMGMKGTKKLQDYFTDAKIPREERDNLQLLCAGHKVLWVQGGPISDDCKLDATSRYVLLLELHTIL